MKRITIIAIAFVSVLLSSCNNKASHLRKEAEKAMNTIFRDYAKDPTSVQISNVSTMFSNDSLCILHLDMKAKNGFGNETYSRMEYIYMTSGNQNYEAYQEIATDSVYQNKETFEKKKIGQIYETLSYENALYYRAALLVNTGGRVVGDKPCEIEVNIPMPTNTGFWDIGSYKDEFGEVSGKKFLLIGGKGYFSNSATTGERMTGYLIVDKESAFFRFIEYDTHIVKDDEDCRMKIKDCDGDVTNFNLYNNSNGRMEVYNQSDLREILRKGGIISISAEMGKYTTSKYVFKMNVSGFSQAYDFLCQNADPKAKEYKLENENFLKENSKKEGVVTLPSGLQYKIIKKGTGRIPNEYNRVKVHYEGSLIDGTIFDSSYERGEPSCFSPSQVIDGWKEALTHMPVGSIWMVYIPQELAYGEREISKIKSYSTLIFKIELLGIEN